jgi:uncharacterized protein YuzE
VRITYDTEVDALTIVVSRESVDRTVDVREGRYIDLAADGNVVALEIIDASHGFELRDLMAEYDLSSVIEALVGQIEKARKLLREDDQLRELVG